MYTSHYSHLEKPNIPLATQARKTTTYILHVVSITTHTHDRHKSIGGKETKKRKEDKGKERKEKKNETKRKRQAKRRKRQEKQEKIKQESKERRRGKKKNHTRYQVPGIFFTTSKMGLQISDGCSTYHVIFKKMKIFTSALNLWDRPKTIFTQLCKHRVILRSRVLRVTGCVNHARNTSA